METELGWKKIEEVRNGYFGWLSGWHWDFFLHLSFKADLTSAMAIGLTMKRLKKGAKKFFPKARFGAYILSPRPVSGHAHVHALLAFDRGYPQNGNNISKDTIKECWPNYCRIRSSQERTQNVMVGYMVKEKNLMLTRPDQFADDFMRPNLLKKFREQSEWF